MKNNLKRKTWWRTGVLIFISYTLLTLIYIPNFFLDEQTNLWLKNLGQTALGHYIWAILTPLVFLSGRRYAVEHSKLVRNLFLQFCLGLIFSTIHTLLLSLIWDVLSGNSPLISLLRDQSTFFHFITKGFIYYVGISAVSQAVYYSYKYRDREFRLQQAELQTLKTQLHPHFLFNTLNAISALVYSSPKDADRAITQLSELLRTSLQSGKNEEVPLKEELDFLKSYLQIHKTLMEDRLDIRWRVSPEIQDAAVPNMILQPLVENSIQHGLAPRAKGGYIEIEGTRQNGNLFLTVRDNGLGVSNSLNSDGGVGLSNTRARLQYLYGDMHDFKFTDTPGGGATFTIKIPFRKQITENQNENSNINS